MPLMSAMIARLPSRALVRVQGPDWRAFLQGLLTQDVGSLTPEALRYGALLSPQGRLLFDFMIWGLADGCALETDEVSAEALAARLKLYRLRAKVEIDVVEADVFAGWGATIQGPEWRMDPRAPALGLRSLAHQPASADAEDYAAHRLGLGVPDGRTDAVETDYPIELNVDLMQGFDFHKGCFIGQETSSRMHRRGGVKNRLAPLAYEGPPPPFGAEILVGDRRAGTVRGSAGGRALALLRLDRMQSGPLRAEGRPMTLVLPPWLKFALSQATEILAPSR